MVTNSQGHGARDEKRACVVPVNVLVSEFSPHTRTANDGIIHSTNPKDGFRSMIQNAGKMSDDSHSLL